MKCREHDHRHHNKPTKDAFEFRSIDGSKLAEPDLNPSGPEFARIDPANFADGFVTPRNLISQH